MSEQGPNVAAMSPVDRLIEALEPFPMLGDTPSIPKATARIIYAAYHGLYPGQTFERIAERGGFGWSEVAMLFKDLKRRNPRLHKELIEQSRAALSSPEPVGEVDDD